MKKLMTLCLAAFALLGMSACSQAPVVAHNDLPIVNEAMWSAGGGTYGDEDVRKQHEQEYKAAVMLAADKYAAVMDKECKTKEPFDVSSVAKVYRVYTPNGLEHVRDKWIRKMVATMACITMNRDGEQLAANL